MTPQNAKTTLICVVCLASAIGCSNGYPSIHKTDGVTITVTGHGNKRPATESTAPESLFWKSGDTTYGLDHMRLKVNGEDYGALKAKDEVVIDIGPPLTVRINGASTKPINGTPNSSPSE